MVLKDKSQVREVHGIDIIDKQRIIDFLQGAVYCWCKNRPDEWFSMRDLMGGDNFYWEGTPLYKLFVKHISNGLDSTTAIKKAGIDSGWLLKKVINNDKREFDSKTEDMIRKYKWKR